METLKTFLQNPLSHTLKLKKPFFPLGPLGPLKNWEIIKP